jgi:hypothetical protein
MKSHGCANLAPRDAHYLFDWLEPHMPPGWTGLRNWDLTPAPVVHVRDSSRAQPFVQDRNVGPPDKEDEEKRMEAAVARRAQAAAEAQLAAQQAAGMIVPGAVPVGTPAAGAPLPPAGTAVGTTPAPAVLQVKPVAMPPAAQALPPAH